MSFGNASKVSLDLRGTRLSLEREALMELPESVLLCLFPNGVVLSPQRLPRTDGETDDDEEEDVYYVDVSLLSCPQTLLPPIVPPSHRMLTDFLRRPFSTV